jgi:hypothetical protein
MDMNPNFEYYILNQALNDYKSYIETYKQVYINTKKYFRYLELKDKHTKEFHWFKVGNILGFTNMMDIMNYLISNGLTDTSIRTSEQSMFASTTLTKLYQVINEQESINFYLEKSEQLDKVLHIFIRINSGGTKLSYSDLLLFLV